MLTPSSSGIIYSDIQRGAPPPAGYADPFEQDERPEAAVRRAAVPRLAIAALESWDRTLTKLDDRQHLANKFLEGATEVLRLARPDSSPEAWQQLVDDLYDLGTRHGLGDDAAQTLLQAAAAPRREGPPAKVIDEYAEPVWRDEYAPAPSGLEPLVTFDASQWEGVSIPPRQWLVSQRIPLGEPGIMSGDGGTGKTKLALQLGIAVAAGLPDWAGSTVDVEGAVIVYSAEEKLVEMHRRTADVTRHRGISFCDLGGRLHFICDHEDNILGAPDRNGVVQPTTALLRLKKTVELIRPALVIIENAADVYAGSEIDRTSVTRFMRQILGVLTVPSNATVMLIQHPSVSGLNDGTGRSGSTAWNNAGRWRTNFTRIRSDEASGQRQLEFIKNNYGPDGEKVLLNWNNGAFVPEGTQAPMSRLAEEAKVDDLFLRLLDRFAAQGREVRETTGNGYAPAAFEDEPEAKTAGVKARAFKNAITRLFAAGEIVTVQGKRSKHIERAPAKMGQQC